MFNYDYINELQEIGSCIYQDGETLQEMSVNNKEVCLAIYEFQFFEGINAYSMLCNFKGIDEDKGVVWVVGISSGIGSQKVFNSRKETDIYYGNLKKKAPEGFKLIYEGNKNIG